jgi:DNA-binding MurR/RpiR family transcriptional regulator
MGCSGWTTFKMQYQESLRHKKQEVSSYTSSILDFLQVFQQDERKQQQITQASGIIKNSTRVIFIGAGPSGVMAKFGSMLFVNIGKPTHYIDQPYYPIAQDDYSNTVIIALSVSGETQSIIARLSRFKELGAKIISVTNTISCTISKMSDVSLSYYVPEEEFFVSEQMAQIHITLTTQMPVVYLIEDLAHKIMV